MQLTGFRDTENQMIIFNKTVADDKQNTNLENVKFPTKIYKFASDFFEEYNEILNENDVICIFAKKNSGKSWIGYELMNSYFHQNFGNIIYGRLQEAEKKVAKAELLQVLLDYELNPQVRRGFKDYIFVGDTDNYLRMVNVSSYQQLRGALGTNTNFIWFDEINAYAFPANFEEILLNIFSTLARNNRPKILLTGNNESSLNNPLFNIFQMKMDWNFTGAQASMRIINGIRVCFVALGGDCFNKLSSFAEKLAENNEPVYNKFYLGKFDNTNCERVLNLKEDYEVKKPIWYWNIENVNYLIADVQVDDKLNKIKTKGLIIKKVYETPEKIPKYTSAPDLDALTTDFIFLTPENTADKINLLYNISKQGKLFFDSFDTQMIWQEELAVYNPKLIKEGIWLYDRFKELK